MTDKALVAKVEETTRKLGEYFDAVQVLVTWDEEGVTRTLKTGCGNWHARQGMAREFLEEDQAQTAAVKLANEPRDPPDGTDDWKHAPGT